MAQPQWVTSAGSLGTIPLGVYYTNQVTATGAVRYQGIAGVFPDGMQLSPLGVLSGVPTSTQVLPRDTEYRFTIRAYSADVPPKIADRTFSLTITSSYLSEWITPSGTVETAYSSSYLDYQFQYTDPAGITEIKLVSGTLPPGTTLSAKGLLSGYVQPPETLPSQDYSFTLQLVDGVSSSLRTFSVVVYDRAILEADTTLITDDNTFIDASETPYSPPFLINGTPSNLGTFRSDNYFAYEFIGENYSGEQISYAIAVNQGIGLPPIPNFDSGSGWYYGLIPDQGSTTVDYSFIVTPYQTNPIGTPITCTATTAGTNLITCNSTSQLSVGQAINFVGTEFGGIRANADTLYFVYQKVSPTTFSIATTPTATAPFDLTTATGSLTANLIVAGPSYPYEITISAAVDAEVTWITDSDLGAIPNGSTSILKVEAVNRGGRELYYRLESGAYNQLPQGLELLPSGDIVGRVSFDTFALDLGETTFDRSYNINRNAASLGTTFDSKFTFTVNAYSPEIVQTVYKVGSVSVVNGGGGYSNITLPEIEFSSPIGATAVQAQVGNVTVSGGKITAVEVADPGDGYTMDNPATVTITQGFGGSGAELEANMVVSGSRDVISVYKTFTVTVYREYNKPYQNLYVKAMPPQNDRELIASLLDNDNIFVPEYIFRPDDPNFGKAKDVVYYHAFGLNPDTLETYVSALYENHYWKNVTLGEIKTAQARNAAGEVVYEVVYSLIVDDLVNNDNVSVGKIVNLPYEVDNSVTQVYPNSLDNMRTQMVDVVGQISYTLPLWMTSRQSDGSVLGFTPAWVIAYTKPGRSNQIAYYLNTEFSGHLNQVDFKIDRYELDALLTRNWDPTKLEVSGDIIIGPGGWTPDANQTTFDKFSSGSNTFLTTVNYGTDLAFADVNYRTISYINNLGGLDGVSIPRTGDTLIFVKQEDYNGPPGSNYDSTDAAWSNYYARFDEYGYDQTVYPYDASNPVPGGDVLICTDTVSGTNEIICSDTTVLVVGQEIVFTSGVIGGITAGQTYWINSIDSSTAFTISNALGGSVVSLTTDSGTMTARSADQRMAIYTVTVDPVTTVVTLTLTTQTRINEYVQVTQGSFYRSAYLFYPSVPAPGYTRISWQPLPTVVTAETTFDHNSLLFIEPVDMYNPTDEYDKYLVFPKSNILD